MHVSGNDACPDLPRLCDLDDSLDDGPALRAGREDVDPD
jgi:hypothetical protein